MKSVGLIGAIVCLTLAASANGGPNKQGQPTIVIHPASPTNEYYKPYYQLIADFMVSYANKVIGRDNLIMFTQKENFEALSSQLPSGVCLPSTVDDIWMRDPTAAKMSAPVKFMFRPSYQKNDTAKYIQGTFQTTMKKYGITPYVVSSNLVIDGGSVVDNDKDTAILTSRVVKDNPGVDVKAELKKAFNYTRIVIIDELPGDTTGHADGMVSFIDTNVVAMTQLEEKDNERIKKQLKDQLSKDTKVIVLPSNYKPEIWRNFTSACGLHTNALVTDDFIYVPTFGHDKANWKYGTKPEDDKKVLKFIQENTRKEVVPVPVPHKVCRMGGNVRCLSWQVKGPIADKLVAAAEKYNAGG